MKDVYLSHLEVHYEKWWYSYTIRFIITLQNSFFNWKSIFKINESNYGRNGFTEKIKCEIFEIVLFYTDLFL